MVIALGYRVQSQVATRFRRWATQRLHEYIQKGFAMDDERLKQGGNRYFRELLQRIRDIRSSERNFYQQVTYIYATPACAIASSGYLRGPLWAHGRSTVSAGWCAEHKAGMA